MRRATANLFHRRGPPNLPPMPPKQGPRDFPPMVPTPSGGSKSVDCSKRRRTPMPKSPEEIVKQIDDIGANLGTAIANVENRVKAVEDASKASRKPAATEKARLPLYSIIRGRATGRWDGAESVRDE